MSSATLSARHYLATEPADVEGRFVREIMLSLDGISAVLGDKAQERERIHPCNVCDKAFMSMQMLSQHKMLQQSVFTCKGCGKNFNPNISINRHNKLVCGKTHHRKRFFHFSEWGKDNNLEDHPQSECIRGGGK